jgi:ribulose-5-phosphate 4-epimerase/fuculose-1-phosphate aldolase
VGPSRNLSLRSGEHVAITPRGLDSDDLRPELVSVVDLDGAPVEWTLPMDEVERVRELMAGYGQVAPAQ